MDKQIWVGGVRSKDGTEAHVLINPAERSVEVKFEHLGASIKPSFVRLPAEDAETLSNYIAIAHERMDEVVLEWEKASEKLREVEVDGTQVIRNILDT